MVPIIEFKAMITHSSTLGPRRVGYLTRTPEPGAAMPQRKKSSKSGRLGRVAARKAVRAVKKARSSTAEKGAAKKTSSSYTYRFLGHFGSGTVRERDADTLGAGHRSRKKSVAAKKSGARKRPSARY